MLAKSVHHLCEVSVLLSLCHKFFSECVGLIKDVVVQRRMIGSCKTAIWIRA